MGKATVIYKGVEKVSPNKKYQWSIVYPGKNAQYAHNDFDRLAMAMVIKGSANNFCRQMRNWEVNTLAFAKKEYDEFKLREKELSRSAFLRNWPGHITVLGMIKHLEDKWFSGTKEKVFEKWVLHFMDADWVTQKEKSDMFAISLRKIDYSLVIHHKKFGDAPIPIKSRSAPYGTQSRYERNQCAVLDMLAEKLPSFKKNKKAKAKANKKTFRSNAKNEIKQMTEYYSDNVRVDPTDGLWWNDGDNFDWYLNHVINDHYTSPEQYKVVDFYNLLAARQCPELYPGYVPMFEVDEELVDYDLELRDAYRKEWYANWKDNFYERERRTIQYDWVEEGIRDGWGDIDWADRMSLGKQNPDF